MRTVELAPLTVNIPKTLKHSLKIYSAKKGKDMTEVITQLLSNLLKKDIKAN